MSVNRKFLLAIVAFIVILIGIAFALSKSLEVKTDLQLLEDEGSDHVGMGTPLNFKTDPPTSGTHYADWTRPGVYETPQQDGLLVHSLEHGYIVVSYNCAYKTGWNLIPTTYAHGLDEELEGLESTQSSLTVSTESAEMTEFKLEDCHKLVDELIALYEEKGKTRIIITPRLKMDNRLTLTAWRRMLKLNPSTVNGLSEPEKNKIRNFIDTFRNKGPEKTME